METIKVAIVEDTATVRETIVMFLENTEGYTCVGVYSNAEDALEALPKVNPHIVIMDIGLPGVSGIDCIRKLKPVCTGTQFLVCTVFEDDGKIFEAIQAGATGYLLKQTPPTKILAAVRDLYEGGSPMSGAIARRIFNLMQAPKKHDEFEQLSDREKEVITLLAKGFRYKEISSQLNISFFTVSTHVHNIYEKLQVQSRTEAVNKIFHR
jgi:DNA-binding NarL/FixJ family response regulator